MATQYPRKSEPSLGFQVYAALSNKYFSWGCRNVKFNKTATYKLHSNVCSNATIHFATRHSTSGTVFVTIITEVTWLHPEDGGSMVLRNVGILPLSLDGVTTQKATTWKISSVALTTL